MSASRCSCLRTVPSHRTHGRAVRESRCYVRRANQYREDVNHTLSLRLARARLAV
jgi:hypothetical protein